jgi:hypothetical protein
MEARVCHATRLLDLNLNNGADSQDVTCRQQSTGAIGHGHIRCRWTASASTSKLTCCHEATCICSLHSAVAQHRDCMSLAGIWPNGRATQATAPTCFCHVYMPLNTVLSEVLSIPTENPYRPRCSGHPKEWMASLARPGLEAVVYQTTLTSYSGPNFARMPRYRGHGTLVALPTSAFWCG